MTTVNIACKVPNGLIIASAAYPTPLALNGPPRPELNHGHGHVGAGVTQVDEDVSADGTRVVGRYRYEGTHTGNFLGYAATGNAFAMRSIDIWRVEDGRFVEHWDELNTLDIFIQVGAVPPPGQ